MLGSGSRSLRLFAAASLALMTACSGEAPTEAAARAATAAKPGAKDWTRTIVGTAKGGILIGNPAAKVKLLEYGSYTCPHCALFEREGVPALLRNYVAKGDVSYEFRSFPIHGAVDVAMTLLEMCQTPAAAWKFSSALFQSQEQLIAGFQAIKPEEATRLQSLPPAQAIGEYADMGGLDDFAKLRGVPKARFSQCMANQANLAKIEASAKEAQDNYKLTGTPWFVLDGDAVPNTSNWTALEPKIQEALK